MNEIDAQNVQSSGNQVSPERWTDCLPHKPKNIDNRQRSGKTCFVRLPLIEEKQHNTFHERIHISHVVNATIDKPVYHKVGENASNEQRCIIFKIGSQTMKAKLASLRERSNAIGFPCSVMVFSKTLVEKLSDDDVRLPPNYVGVRNIRPGTCTDKKDSCKRSSVVFKVTDDKGNERRMTRQEKKEFKKNMAREQKRSLKRQYDEAVTSEPLAVEEETAQTPQLKNHSSEGSSYANLSIDPAILEQEKQERSVRFLPVILSPPMAWQATDILAGNCKKESLQTTVRYSRDLSLKWAEELKKSLESAETTRKNEVGIRPMAYELTPEVWSRMRPVAEEEPFIATTSIPASEGNVNPGDDHLNPQKDWISITCRPASRFDFDAAMIFEYIRRKTSFHVSCGAKFGSDFLIYDGRREERHAFAGMRVLTATEGMTLPKQTPYSLAGYVRCLNTAGKLALLATVIVDEPSDEDKTTYSIAIVDVALEKILTAPTHVRYSRTEVRRDVGKNLAKAS